MDKFNYFHQHNYCVSTRQAVKSYPSGNYLCVRWGGICSWKKCERLIENGAKVVDIDTGSGKIGQN